MAAANMATPNTRLTQANHFGNVLVRNITSDAVALMTPPAMAALGKTTQAAPVSTRPVWDRP